MKSGFSNFNERLFSSKEVSGVGTVGTMRLLRGVPARLLNFVGRALSYTSTRSYGCFFVSFGVLSLLLYLGDYYFRLQSEVPLHTLLLCAAIAIAAIPLLFFSKPVCIAFQDFTITDRLFFEFLTIKRMHRNIVHQSIPPIAAVFLGFIPAVLSYLFSVELVLLGFIVLVLVIIAFTSPEFSMILSVILFPYLPLFPNSTILLCSFSVITFLSYAMKVVIGKRRFSFDVYSLILIALIFVTLLGGIIGYGGTNIVNSFAVVTLVVGYFPISNVVINRRLADSVVNAVVISAIPITVLSFIEFIVEHPSTSFAIPTYSTPGVSVFFSSPSALSAFMLVAFILTTTLVLEKKTKLEKSVYSFVLLLELAVLCIVMQPGALLATLFGIIAYFIIKSRKIPVDTLILLPIIAHLFFLLPSGIIDFVYGYMGVSPLYSERFEKLKEAVALFGENLWFGVDIRGSGRVNSMAGYNTFFGVGLELGVIALALFVFLLIIRLRHLSYYRFCTRNSGVSSVGDMTAVAIISLFVYGAFENVFADITVSYIFLLVFALSTAALRTAKRENDDLLGYYGDSRSSDSSALDVSVTHHA